MATEGASTGMVNRALLLAGGHGTRLRPITDTIPKCLVPIGGKALLDHWLDALFAADFERAIVNTHWLAEKVRAHLGSSRWKDRVDIVHEERLLGTAGTVLENRKRLEHGPFLLAHADNFATFSVERLCNAHSHRPKGCAITMLAFETEVPETCGILKLDERDVVVEFHEKVENPPGNLANGAVYVVEPEVIGFIAAIGRREIDLSTEVLPHYLGRIFAVRTDGYHRDIGTPESLKKAQMDYQDLQHVT